ncbi:Uncharacterised protein [Bordetella pertussis]|nr:Uncharacterised protein [Bordetella pertussis]
MAGMPPTGSSYRTQSILAMFAAPGRGAGGVQ